jgi:hypothetical protein
VKCATLDSVDEIYACGSDQQASAAVVRHEPTRKFAALLYELEKKVGTGAEDPYLDSVLRPLRSLRYRAGSVPLELSSPHCVPADLAHALQFLVPKCRQIFPEHFAQLEAAADAARLVIACRDAPLLDAIRDVLVDSGAGTGVAILVRRLPNMQLRGELRRRLGMPRIEVVTPSALLTAGVFGHIIAVGPLGWFPPYIRTAPRGHRLTAVSYEWLRDHAALRPSFVSSPENLFRRITTSTNAAAEDSIDQGGMPLHDAAPAFDWEALHSRNSLAQDADGDDEQASARLLLLSGNMAVYVDSASDAKSQVIDTSGDDDPIARIPNDDLEPGTFILLRTGGGGDLIAPVANLILGAKAQEVRARQLQWKEALAALVRQQGDRAVIRALRDLGCQRASYLNLRNWMSYKSIRPDLDDDFLSILLLCNLDSEFKTFDANARLLDRVHRRAGFRIRRMLLDRVSKANMGKLAAEGTMEFDLPGAGGGSFTAYRVEEISPATFSVPAGHLNHPFDAGTQWLE